ncbi:MAG: hypothetical protein AAFY91_10560 [Bacteroidota bacterium]
MAARATSSRSSKKANGRHKFWVLWTDGNSREYYSNDRQDADLRKFKEFTHRIFGKRMQLVGIIRHYQDGTLIREYRSDLKRWLQADELEPQLNHSSNQKDAHRHTQPKATNRPGQSSAGDQSPGSGSDRRDDRAPSAGQNSQQLHPIEGQEEPRNPSRRDRAIQRARLNRRFKARRRLQRQQTKDQEGTNSQDQKEGK